MITPNKISKDQLGKNKEAIISKNQTGLVMTRNGTEQYRAIQDIQHHHDTVRCRTVQNYTRHTDRQKKRKQGPTITKNRTATRDDKISHTKM